jgi:cysteine desulfurase/selenocysteine lyase
MSDKKVIYFDNAATSYPKPEVVYQIQDDCFRRSGNPGRGAHRMAFESARTVFESRCSIARFLEIDNPERLIFTPGCTYSLNMVLRGFPFPSRKAGAGVIVSATEHNAVMRPLDRLERAGVVKVHRLSYAPNKVADLAELQQTIEKVRPVLCAIQEGSNVTGERTDIVQIWEICRTAKVSLLIDAAQTAGIYAHKLSQFEKCNEADLFWCASGHKGLMGPAGIGLLYWHGTMQLEPLIDGGTGSNSESLRMPLELPDRLESGTMPVQSIAALAKGVDWLEGAAPAKLADHELSLTRRVLDWCFQNSYMKVAGDRGKQANRNRAGHLEVGLPVVSFSVEGVAAHRVADILDQDFGIAVRSGLHCAMAAHQSLGTLTSGLTRASFGCFNSADEVDQLCQALARIHKRGAF